MKLLIIILIAISLTSCKHREKYEFIQKYLENPDKIEEILKSSDFQSDYFIKGYLKSEIGRQNLINRALKFVEFTNDGKKSIYFDIVKYGEYDATDSKFNLLLRYIICIINKEKNAALLFEWELTKDNKWYLLRINELDDDEIKNIHNDKK
jgi:hypothetical protein